MEVVIVMFLFLISIELALILINLTTRKEEKEEKTHSTRREIQGTFSNPLGDSYRKNRGLYVPVVPNSKMLDGDEEDEV